MGNKLYGLIVYFIEKLFYLFFFFLFFLNFLPSEFNGKFSHFCILWGHILKHLWHLFDVMHYFESHCQHLCGFFFPEINCPNLFNLSSQKYGF